MRNNESDKAPETTRTNSEDGHRAEGPGSGNSTSGAIGSTAVKGAGVENPTHTALGSTALGGGE